jgi:hypothetical protein
MIAAAEPRRAPPQKLVDPRVAKLGGHRRSPKSNYEFPGMMDEASWRRTEVHRHTHWYGGGLCGVKLRSPHAVYTHLAKRHPERFESKGVAA